MYQFNNIPSPSGSRTSSGKKALIWLLFLIYSYGMLHLLLLGRSPYTGNITFSDYCQTHLLLAPFHNIKRFAHILLTTSSTSAFYKAFKNLFGNILLFIPIGLFFPALFRHQRKFGYFLLTTTLLIACIETLQLILWLGYAETDDIILNDLGASFGFACWAWKQRFFPNRG